MSVRCSIVKVASSRSSKSCNPPKRRIKGLLAIDEAPSLEKVSIFQQDDEFRRNANALNFTEVMKKVHVWKSLYTRYLRLYDFEKVLKYFCILKTSSYHTKPC